MKRKNLKLLSDDIISVQPSLSQPTGKLFYMDFKYKESIYNITLFIDGIKIIPTSIFYRFKDDETNCKLEIEFLDKEHFNLFSERFKNPFNNTIKEIKVVDNKNIRLIKFKKLMNPNYNMEKELLIKFNNCTINEINDIHGYFEFNCEKFEKYDKK